MPEIEIQIIGAGVVGKAFGKTLVTLGYKVNLKDLHSGTFNPEADIFFICTHEKDVLGVLLEYFKSEYKKPIVIRSTMSPSMFRRLWAKFPRLHLSTNPEFLRQSRAEEDSLHPEFHVIGECCKEHGNLMKKILQDLNCTIIRTSPETALMIKLAHNAFLTTLISFWNEIANIVPEKDSTGIGKACSNSLRIPEYGTRFNGPFAGSCLPKDLDQLIKYAEERGVDPILLEAVRKVNRNLVKKDDKTKV